MKSLFLGIFIFALLCSCTQQPDQKNVQQGDPLPSWNEGPSKQAIINFVKETTYSGSESFIPAKERIVVFDNDGTLWSEQPMLDVLDYLRANGFKTYIVSGGGIDFMRVLTEEVYGIPPEQVIGSYVKYKFEVKDGLTEIVKLPEIDFIDDKEGKPIAIHRFIGRRPVAAFGNSDGDLAMLKWTEAGAGTGLMVYIHHTDSDREWAYDRESHIGRLDKGLDEANEKGWIVVDMKSDWKYIYPHELSMEK